jgi:asparagine synthase (glutamine-hydrolysing)
MRDLWQEMRELGPLGTAFRLGWELKVRTGIASRLGSAPLAVDPNRSRPQYPALDWTLRLRFPDPASVASAMSERVSTAATQKLLGEARQAVRGRIVAFGKWIGDYGEPIDWHLNPTNGRRWNPGVHWTRALDAEEEVGDVKLTWEIGRFPHAYAMARAAAYHPDAAEEMAAALFAQLRSFTAENPFGRGIHWSSGQEIAFRLMAWVFAFDVLLSRCEGSAAASAILGDALRAGATHIERHVDYARRAIYNNHVLAEAVALLMVGTLLPDSPPADGWRRRGWELLSEAADRQFLEDGAYIQESHNYHRVVLQDLLWAWLFARVSGAAPDPSWRTALGRSLDFLLAHQNPLDGRLPNYGANDGSLPSPLSTCDFSDFRPTLQAVSLAARGERIFEPGPWDEEAAWLLGPQALDAPLRPLHRRSVSFPVSGYHMFRGAAAETFAAFRCGSLRDRFSQIDMLQLDLWWRGQNVLVDGGSYLYNGPAVWHAHFLGTASHNTVVVDSRDQMLHRRRFKVLYWTRALLGRFEDSGHWAVAWGEHYGYRRHPGGCRHRRSVLFVKDDLWVVLDQVFGTGTHHARLHWLAGEFPFEPDEAGGRLDVSTPEGQFGVAIHDVAAHAIPVSVVAGQEDPPRGWLSRYYGQKVAVASMAAEVTGGCPLVLISVLGAGRPRLELSDGTYMARAGRSAVAFRINDGLFEDIST